MARRKKKDKYEEGYNEGHDRFLTDPCARSTMGTAWGIRRKWIPESEKKRLRDYYLNLKLPKEQPKPKIRRRPGANDLQILDD